MDNKVEKLKETPDFNHRPLSLYTNTNYPSKNKKGKKMEEQNI